MRIEIEHKLGRNKAKEKIDGLFEEITGNISPEGVKIVDFNKKWDDYLLAVDAKVRHSFIKVDLKGFAMVYDDRVVIEFEIPVIVKKLVGEDKIRDKLAAESNKLLNG